MRRRAALIVLVILAHAASVRAAPKAGPKDGPAEEMTYTPPAGWEKTEQERIVVFSPPGVPPTKCAILVTPGETLEGDFLKWFKGKWDALRKGAKVVQGGERTGQDGPGGSSVLYQAALMEGEAAGGVKRKTGLLLYAVHVGSAVHWVVFRTDGGELFNTHKKTANQFLAGLKFVQTTTAGGEAEADPEPKPAQGPAPKKGPLRKRAPAGEV